jgi:trans-2,3-dihydro-3-hydroxyanthranilate isomerase
MRGKNEMKSAKYVIADVFTDKQFGGNQLAVFTEGRGLDSALMQDIAREINYSETTFLLPPVSGGDYRVRIFTPARELPFAGHPLVGSAYVIVSERMKEWSERLTTVRMETGAGLIPAGVRTDAGVAGETTMTQPLPEIKGDVDDRSAFAAALCIPPSEIERTGLPIQLFYNGLTVIVAPVKGLAAIQNMKPDFGALERLAAGHGAETILVFTLETVAADSTAHCRVFAPGAGVFEDAATGSANGPLGYYLVHHRAVPAEKSAHIRSEQGFEMKRPSILNIEVTVDAGTRRPTIVRVGGGVVISGRGEIFL